MADELKATVINMKSLSQNIPDPVVVGAGDANGRTLRIIFTQEAAAQMTEDTKVYLSWHHQEVDIKGYNVFTHIINEDDEDFPPTWEITYHKSMLYEGNVLACIQLVDSVSIATSTNFMIRVLMNPNDGSRYTATDDFSEFQKAVISLTTLSDEMKRQMANQKIEFEDMQLEFMDVRRIAQNSEDVSTQAREIAEQALTTAREALNTIVDLTDVARDARDIAQEAKDDVAQANQEIEELKERMDREENVVAAIDRVAQSALEIAEAIEEHQCQCGVTEEQMNEAIGAAIQEQDENIDAVHQELVDAIGQVEDNVKTWHTNDLTRMLTIREFI